MGDYELSTPWIKQQFDHHPRRTIAVFSTVVSMLVYVGVYKGIEFVKERVQPSAIERIVDE